MLTYAILSLQRLFYTNFCCALRWATTRRNTRSPCLRLAASKIRQPPQLKPPKCFSTSPLKYSKPVISTGWGFLSLNEVFHMWSTSSLILKLKRCNLKRKAQNNGIVMCLYHKKITYIVDKETNVLKAPGVIVLMWLSYRESSLTELSPAKVSLFIQLIELLLSILKGLKQGIRNYWEEVQFQDRRSFI